MVGIALNHPFVDGNKRTGYISGMTFLQINKWVTVRASLNDAQMGMWLEQVVNRQMTFMAFVTRLRKRLSQP